MNSIERRWTIVSRFMFKGHLISPRGRWVRCVKTNKRFFLDWQHGKPCSCFTPRELEKLHFMCKLKGKQDD